VEGIDLPDTDSTEVMQQAVSLWLVNIIWDQHSRGVHPDNVEEDLLTLYSRVFESVRKAHKGK